MHAERVVATMDAHRGEVAMRVVGTGNRIGHRSPVQGRGVIRLLQRVGDELPVGAHLRVVVGGETHLREGEAAECGRDFAQILRKAFTWRSRDEHEAFPHLAGERLEVQRCGIEVRELLAVRQLAQRAS